MALKAKITQISQSSDSIRVDFELYDSATPETIIATRDIQIDYPDISGLTNNQIQTLAVNKIKAIGAQYQNVADKVTYFQTRIGVEVTI